MIRPGRRRTAAKLVHALLFSALAVGLAPYAAAQDIFPRIVNGTPTVAYPSAGALLFYPDRALSSLSSLCSATLVGCRTALTAAHCICVAEASDAQACIELGLEDPGATRLFLPQVGFLEIESMTIHPDFVFGERGDIALIRLVEPVTGVLPSPINTSAKLPFGTSATIVGYGRTSGRARDGDDSGIKRFGPVTTSACDSDIPDETHVCWEFRGDGSSTCTGDSGGPLFVRIDDLDVLAGVTSGGNSSTCLAPDLAFQTDVLVYRDWIAELAQEQIGAIECSEVPVAGSAGVISRQLTGIIDADSPEGRLSVDVPPGTERLRIALNGQLVREDRFNTSANDFDLYVRAGEAASRAEFDCRDTTGGTFGFCEQAAPEPGLWHVLVDQVEGEGQWQVTVTLFGEATEDKCVGDCDGDDRVTVDEIVAAVAMALGTGEVCGSIDVDGDGRVTVDEIVVAVTNGLNGCS